MSVREFRSKNQKIYSRYRITIPKISSTFKANRNKTFNRKKSSYKVIVIILVEVLVVKNIINAINPLIETICKNRAKSIATIIANKQANIVMNEYNYQDLAVIIKDESGKIQMVKLNIVPVNKITSDVALAIQENLNNVSSMDFGIRMGSVTGVRLLSGSGPYIKVKMSTIGNVSTELKSEFKTAGINQTLHQIYLDVSCEVAILTPYSTTTETINNQILIAESIIVGEIPSSYYNFDNIDSRGTLEVIK